MFKIKKTLARNTNADLEDMANIKFALTSLGYYDDSRTGLSPYADGQLFHSIRSFQNENDLKVDGVIEPEGPTQEKIKGKLGESTEMFGAYADFLKNYWNMREANTIGADKYFHCVANYEAAKRGWNGRKTAESLSKARLRYKQYKGNTSYDLFQDQTANIFGREAADFGEFQSARDACSIFRPEGLDEKY